MKPSALAIASCVGALATFVASTASAIVGGTADTTRPEVLLLQDDTLAGFRCTATLIAPNLVITARHCVGKRSTGTTLCRGGATDEGAQSLPNYSGNVAASPMHFSATPSSPLLARAAAIYDDGATTTCSHDLALIALDRSVPDITPALLRRTAVAKGDALIVMGFGWTDRNATVNANERMKALTNVLAVGPVVHAFKPFGDGAMASQPLAIAPGELGVNGLTMTGDSGGPAFDADGNLAALVSRGYADAFYGPGTLTSIASHLATIDVALTATGNAPLGEADAGADASAPPARDAGAEPEAPDGSDPAADAGAANGSGSGSATTSGCSITAAIGPHGGGNGLAVAAATGALAALTLASRRRRSPTTQRKK